MKKLLLLFSLAAFTAVFALDRFVIKEDPDGTTFGTSATQKAAFHGATPVAQRSGADGTALTDSTGGDVTGATLAATAGVSTIAIPVNLVTVADGDVLTTYTPGYKFKILSVDAAVTNEVTTADKASTLNVEIGTTNLTGGAVALTSANTATLGAVVAGSAVTAANTGAADATISIEAASTTAFAEGQVVVLIRIQNMDVADNEAKTAELVNELRATLVEKGLHAGS